jgi:hypothetical protein
MPVVYTHLLVLLARYILSGCLQFSCLIWIGNLHGMIRLRLGPFTISDHGQNSATSNAHT